MNGMNGISAGDVDGGRESAYQKRAVISPGPVHTSPAGFERMERLRCCGSDSGDSMIGGFKRNKAKFIIKFG